MKKIVRNSLMLLIYFILIGICIKLYLTNQNLKTVCIREKSDTTIIKCNSSNEHNYKNENYDNFRLS